MKREKNKVILIYSLMILVVALIVALTFTIINNPSKKVPKESTANVTPTVDVNPYPTINEECTFSLTLNEYNGITGPKCKGGYSRYNITGIALEGKKINISVIYTDQEGNKSGLYVNDQKATTKVDDLARIKLGIFDNKLFILDNNDNASNVLVYDKDQIKVYDLKETLEENKISDPAFQNAETKTISNKTIDPNSFNFTAGNFTFKTRLIDAMDQVISGGVYKVTFSGNDFSKPVFVSAN